MRPVSEDDDCNAAGKDEMNSTLLRLSGAGELNPLSPVGVLDRVVHVLSYLMACPPPHVLRPDTAVHRI